MNAFESAGFVINASRKRVKHYTTTENGAHMIHLATSSDLIAVSVYTLKGGTWIVKLSGKQHVGKRILGNLYNERHHDHNKIPAEGCLGTLLSDDSSLWTDSFGTGSLKQVGLPNKRNPKRLLPTLKTGLCIQSNWFKRPLYKHPKKPFNSRSLLLIKALKKKKNAHCCTFNYSQNWVKFSCWCMSQGAGVSPKESAVIKAMWWAGADINRLKGPN